MDKNMRAIRNFIFGLTRPRHRCNACGHTWKPRGNTRSARCPSCRSEDIDLSTSAVLKAVGVVVVLVVVGIWALWIPSPTQEDPKKNHVSTVDPILEGCEVRCKKAALFNNCVKKCMIAARDKKAKAK